MAEINAFNSTYLKIDWSNEITGDPLSLHLDQTSPQTIINGAPIFGVGLKLTAGQDIRPSADSTTAINIAQADGTDFVTFDTTNKRVGIGNTAPTVAFELGTNSVGQSMKVNETLGAELAPTGTFSDTTWGRGTGVHFGYFFIVSSATAPTVGHTYTQSAVTYTVVAVNITGTTGTITCSGASDPTASGTLTAGTAPSDAVYTSVVLNGNGMYFDATGRSTSTALTGTSTTIGTLYKVTVTIANWTVGYISCLLGGVYGAAWNSNGTFTTYIRATTSTKVGFTKENQTRLNVTAVSVKAVTAGTGDVTLGGKLYTGGLMYNGTDNSAVVSGTGVQYNMVEAPFVMGFGIYDSTIAGYILRISCNNASQPFFSFGTGAIGSTAPTMVVYSTTTLSSDLTGIHLGFYCYDANTQSNNSGDFAFGGSSKTITSGQASHLILTRNFTPTSGSGIFNILEFITTINQTGGANGTISGLGFNLTFTSAYDWRAFNITSNTGYNIFAGGTALNFFGGNTGFGITTPTPPTGGASAKVHIGAGTATASTSALKFTPATSVLLTNPEIGAFEPVTDDISYTISTGTARKQLVMTDGTLLVSGDIPIASTNGRLIKGATPLAGTTVIVTAQLTALGAQGSMTFVNGILTASTPAT